MIPISIHDRSHLTAGADAAEAFRRTIDRARYAEHLDYHRFWTAEHHGVPGVAGSAPAVTIAAVAQATSTIRVGAGGVMLPNHQPLVVAEQFATLATLYPGRIDLGLGRSLGFVAPVRQALRRETYAIDQFADDLAELITYLDGSSRVTLMPPVEALPLFVLAVGAGAEVAARLGLPLVIGGPGIAARDEAGLTAADRYRAAYRPSRFATDPVVVLNVTALAADTADEAADLARSEAWAHVASKSTGAFGPLEAPETIRDQTMTDRQAKRLTDMVSTTITGTGGAVAARIHDLATRTGADEVILSGCTYDHAAQVRSDRLIRNAWNHVMS